LLEKGVAPISLRDVDEELIYHL